MIAWYRHRRRQRQIGKLVEELWKGGDVVIRRADDISGRGNLMHALISVRIRQIRGALEDDLMARAFQG